MSEKKNLPQGVSRRRFIATTAAAAMTAGLAKAQYPPSTPQPAPNTGPWTRVSLTDPAAPAMLASYATAITKLLQLPPTDGRNFYRNALVHTLDCPHGNWWFLPWHRGYLGWWEQTVRELSGNPNFAFPYWDWTAQPFVPDAFWSGPLDPANFVVGQSDFIAQLTPAMTAFYNGATSDQKTQLSARGLPTVQSLFNAIVQGDMYFSPSQARSLTKQNPDFDSFTQQTVALSTIEAALATPYFAGGVGNPPTPPGGFGSDFVAQHSDSAGQGILESEPHNNVHNDTGGFMGNFLSPVDPIFMAHHSNIDRLWSIWTAQQKAAGHPTVPTGSLSTWQEEPFLFYFDKAGQPVSPSTCANYVEVGSFNYIYTKGSGAPATATAGREGAPRPSAESVRRVTGTLKASDLGFSKAAVAQVALPGGAAAREGTPPRVRAHITVDPPTDPKGVRFHVFVNPPENALALDANHPSYAGTFEFFGRMHHDKPITFTVPLDDSLSDLTRARTLDASKPLNIHVVPQARGVAMRALPQASVTKVEVTSS